MQIGGGHAVRPTDSPAIVVAGRLQPDRTISHPDPMRMGPVDPCLNSPGHDAVFHPYVGASDGLEISAAQVAASFVYPLAFG